MKLRAATKADIPVLKQLEQAVIDAERPLNSAIKQVNAKYYNLEELISDRNTVLAIGETNNQIIATGYVQIRTSKQQLQHQQHGYLGFMYVTPDMRGQGLNQQIMAYLIEWAKARHVTDFYLDVYNNNTAAVCAYEKLGFEPCLLEMKLHL
ncbi:MAG: GNAT family N-acetyltransferase [Pseudoalteromonas sp.]|uniref:GNAT family N-acetyltransferase n=1 Tax=unclassified Pseudoalteromonas TaxID=194690 RepID=UPI003F99B222